MLVCASLMAGASSALVHKSCCVDDKDGVQSVGNIGQSACR